MVFVPPYDDPYIISGQGTVGNELLRQLSTPDLDSLHAIFVAIGGGGLAAGIAAYVKALRPSVKIYGVEPCGVMLHPASPSLHLTSCFRRNKAPSLRVVLVLPHNSISRPRDLCFMACMLGASVAL